MVTKVMNGVTPSIAAKQGKRGSLQVLQNHGISQMQLGIKRPPLLGTFDSLRWDLVTATQVVPLMTRVTYRMEMYIILYLP